VSRLGEVEPVAFKIEEEAGTGLVRRPSIGLIDSKSCDAPDKMSLGLEAL